MNIEDRTSDDVVFGIFTVLMCIFFIVIFILTLSSAYESSINNKKE